LRGPNQITNAKTLALGDFLIIGPSSFVVAQTVVSRGADMYLQMLLKDNLMHADLHPGNILVQDKAAQIDPLESDGSRMPSDSSSTRIVLVDAGMVARLARREQSAFIGEDFRPFLAARGQVVAALHNNLHPYLTINSRRVSASTR